MNHCTKLPLFLAAEFLLFALASLVHAGILFAGYGRLRPKV